MTACDRDPAEEAHVQCPVCGHALPYEPPIPRFDAPCSECGYHIWCRRRMASGETLLEVLPGRTPEPWEVEQLVEALVKQNAAQHVVVDLSKLDSVDSAFVARLLSLHKRIGAAQGQLILRGLRPLVREMFAHLHLDRAFVLADET